MKKASKEVIANFVQQVEMIVQTQVSPSREYSLLFSAEQPTFEFEGLDAGTALTLRSLNHNTVKLSPKAAALAVSLVAINWTSWAAGDAGEHSFGEEASKLFYALRSRVFNGRKDGLTKEERVIIHRYID